MLKTMENKKALSRHMFIYQWPRKLVCMLAEHKCVTVLSWIMGPGVYILQQLLHGPVNETGDYM